MSETQIRLGLVGIVGSDHSPLVEMGFSTNVLSVIHGYHPEKVSGSLRNLETQCKKKSCALARGGPANPSFPGPTSPHWQTGGCSKLHPCPPAILAKSSVVLPAWVWVDGLTRPGHMRQDSLLASQDPSGDKG